MATEILRPNASGDYSQLTPIGGSINWQMVDDVTPDDLNTYVRSDSDSIYRYDFHNLPAGCGQGSINFIKVWVRTHTRPDGLAALGIITGGSSYFSSGWGDEFGYWVNHSQQWNNNPKTSNPWTWADINALQAGIALRRNDGLSRCTQIYVVVDYTPAPPPPPPIVVTPSTLALVLTEYAPTIEISDHIKVTPTTLALVLTAFAPTIASSVVVTPSTLALLLTLYAPSLTITGRKLKLCVITGQYRDVETITAQYRFLQAITSQYRGVKVTTSQYRLIKAITAMLREIKSHTTGG